MQDQSAAVDRRAAARRPVASRSDRNDADERRAFLPLYTEYEVDPVLSGHDRSYNRGYYGSDENSTVYAVSDSGPKFYSRPTRTGRGAAKPGCERRPHVDLPAVTVSWNTLVYQAVIGYKGKGATTSRRSVRCSTR